MRARRNFVLVVFFMAVLTCLLAAQWATAQQQFGVLRGRVVDAQTGEPVPRARLRLVAYGMTAVADDAGVYVFTGVPVGATTLLAEAPGYQRYTQNIQVFGGEQTLDVLLSPLGRERAAVPPVTAPKETPPAGARLEVNGTVGLGAAFGSVAFGGYVTSTDVVTTQINFPSEPFVEVTDSYGFDYTAVAVTGAGESPALGLRLRYGTGERGLELTALRLTGKGEGGVSFPGAKCAYSSTGSTYTQDCTIRYPDFWNMGEEVLERGAFPVWLRTDLTAVCHDPNGDDTCDDVDLVFDPTEDLHFSPEKATTRWTGVVEPELTAVGLSGSVAVNRGTGSDFRLSAGLFMAQWRHRETQRMTTVFHFEDHVTDLLYCGPSGCTPVGSGDFYSETFHNDVTLASSSTLDYRPFGVTVSAGGRLAVAGPLYLAGEASYAYLTGTAQYRGEFKDTDDITVTVDFDGADGSEPAVTLETDLLSGQSAVSLDRPVQSQLAWGEVRLGAEFGPVDVSVGYRIWYWAGVPLAPRFDYSAVRWETPTGTMSASAWIVGAGLRF